MHIVRHPKSLTDMKKTNTINLVLITAAMAACNRPLYQQRSQGYEDPGYSAGAPAGALTPGPGDSAGAAPGVGARGGTADGPGLTACPGAPADAIDSTNYCPIESSALPPDYYDWYNGTGPFLSFTVDFNINGFYAYRNPAPLVRLNAFRSFFTRAIASFPHPMPPSAMEDHRAAIRNIPASTRSTVTRSGFGARVGMAVHS
jgi:hypothetical protein